MEGYEYRRIQSGASALWTPLRFPGQYFDSETDLFENWNRYYDPSFGRYHEPEPMLSPLVPANSTDMASFQTTDPKVAVKPTPVAGGPSFVVDASRQGHSAPAYAYAGNNPINWSDPSGLCTIVCYRNFLVLDHSFGTWTCVQVDDRNALDNLKQLFTRPKTTCSGGDQNFLAIMEPCSKVKIFPPLPNDGI